MQSSYTLYGDELTVNFVFKKFGAYIYILEHCDNKKMFIYYWCKYDKIYYTWLKVTGICILCMRCG